jgi:hypothetical protein
VISNPAAKAGRAQRLAAAVAVVMKIRRVSMGFSCVAEGYTAKLGQKLHHIPGNLM